MGQGWRPPLFRAQAMRPAVFFCDGDAIKMLLPAAWENAYCRAVAQAGLEPTTVNDATVKKVKK